MQEETNQPYTEDDIFTNVTLSEYERLRQIDFLVADSFEKANKSGMVIVMTDDPEAVEGENIKQLRVLTENSKKY